MSASTLTAESEGVDQEVLDCIAEDRPLTERMRQANARIHFLNGHAVSQRMIPDTEIDASLVLEAMLRHAPTERGKRYTACAIFCCRDNVLELVKLASTWVKFVLWRFKSAYKHGSPPISIHATPTLPITESSMSTVPAQRYHDFAEKLKKRQGIQCAVIDAPHDEVVLVGAHIIRKQDDSAAGVHESRPSTWDILRHYADISDEMMEGLENIIDSPSNGILLEATMHTRFEQFAWYFEPTNDPELPDTYQVQWLGKRLAIFKDHGRDIVKFENHSNEQIDLPTPKFLMNIRRLQKFFIRAA